MPTDDTTAINQVLDFMAERQADVDKTAKLIATAYIEQGVPVALAMLNDVIEKHNLRVWEANVLESKVLREVAQCRN